MLPRPCSNNRRLAWEPPTALPNAISSTACKPEHAPTLTRYIVVSEPAHQLPDDQARSARARVDNRAAARGGRGGRRRRGVCTPRSGSTSRRSSSHRSRWRMTASRERTRRHLRFSGRRSSRPRRVVMAENPHADSRPLHGLAVIFVDVRRRRPEGATTCCITAPDGTAAEVVRRPRSVTAPGSAARRLRITPADALGQPPAIAPDARAGGTRSARRYQPEASERDAADSREPARGLALSETTAAIHSKRGEQTLEERSDTDPREAPSSATYPLK